MSNIHPKSTAAPQSLKLTADLLYQQGIAYLDSANLQPAKEYLVKALKDYSSEPESVGTALCNLKLGRAVELLGEYDQARAIYQQSLDLHIRLKDALGVARSEAFLGNVAWAQGDYTNASRWMEQALSHFKVAGDLPDQSWVTDLLANLQLAQGNDQEAEKLHRAAIAMMVEPGESPVGHAWNDYHLAAVDLFRGYWDLARDGFLRALKIFTGAGDVLGVVATCTHLGEIACEIKDFASAERYILKSLRLVIPTGCKPLLADAMTSLARLQMGQGQNDKALGTLMFVLSHPTCRRQTKDRMIFLAKALEANFSAKEIENGFIWAKHFSMEEMASAYVKSLLDNPAPKGTRSVGLVKSRILKARKKLPLKGMLQAQFKAGLLVRALPGRMKV